MEAFTLLHKDVSQRFHGKTLYGELDELRPRLEAYNQLGYNIFFTVNRTDGRGRRAENITEARFCFSDLDNGLPDRWPLTPTLVVESSPNRYQAYYALESGCIDFRKWERVQRAVVKGTGGDSNAQDLARILRVPGFMNCKRATAHKVHISTNTGITYKLDRLCEVFGEVEVAHQAIAAPLPDTDLPPEYVRIRRFRGWLGTLEAPRGGERNGFLFRAAAKGLRDFAVPADDVHEILEEYWHTHDSSGDDPRLEGIVRNASRSASGFIGSALQPPRIELQDDK